MVARPWYLVAEVIDITETELDSCTTFVLDIVDFLSLSPEISRRRSFH